MWWIRIESNFESMKANYDTNMKATAKEIERMLPEGTPTREALAKILQRGGLFDEFLHLLGH